jgi:hypothetical protein
MAAAYDRTWLRRCGRRHHSRRLSALWLGDASLANPLPGGSSACPLAGCLRLFCSRATRLVTSAISLLVARHWARLQAATPRASGALAAGTVLLVAPIVFVAWLAKAGRPSTSSRERDDRSNVACSSSPARSCPLFGIHAHGNFWENSAFHSPDNPPRSRPARRAGGARPRNFFKNKPVGVVRGRGRHLASGWLGLRRARAAGEVQGLLNSGSGTLTGATGTPAEDFNNPAAGVRASRRGGNAVSVACSLPSMAAA